VLAGRDRAHAAPTFGPAGLYLSRVEYDARWALPRGGREGPIALELAQP
jgi:tRNA pseudouridine38-40 synthase